MSRSGIYLMEVVEGKTDHRALNVVHNLEIGGR